MTAVELRQQRAAVERVDDDDLVRLRGRGLVDPQQEVAWEIDAVDAQAGAARDLEIDDGEADRDPGAPIDHFVEEVVPRIVVMIAVSRETQLVVEVLVEGANRLAGWNASDLLQP